MAQLQVGTSGWSYPHWRERFYPKESKAADWLPYYAKHFSTVELNNSFYRLPSKDQFKEWAARLPDGFIVTVKVSRYITHIKRLRNARQYLDTLLERAEGLGEHLGPLLFQTPPRLRADLERLEELVKTLPEGHRFAFEFRHESWFNEEVYELLKSGGAALCIASSPNYPSKRMVTAPFSFFRFHGGTELHSSEYGEAELSGWADEIGDHLDRGVDVYAYFNNDANAYAVGNAQRLRELVDERRGLLVTGCCRQVT